ncbi:putative disease resistance protein At1g59780 [Brachypodium distachyon]|uniref:putative disease resistance protein At1g59780 n=1 Tax=Brachypodium distachyon TaxID=15368 RepID=UPI0005300908|nr:putative disease resistance protein At1g59780 [Brachypodium distachyon]|eukprot:XP_014758292.1 putative disease resistance protein At1g59780 [Brachypodium distachyon]
MVVALDLAAVNTAIGCINNLVSLLKDHKKQSGEFAGILHAIKMELEIIRLDIEEYEDLRLEEVAHDIVNYINGLWTPGPWGSFILSAVGLDPRIEDIARIKIFMDCIKRVQESLQKRSQPSDKIGSSAATTPGSSSSAESHSSYASEDRLVGISGPKTEIVEMLLSPGDGKLRTFSIVGCVGSGKTALARAIYDDAAVTGNFQCKAWVVASEYCHARDVVEQILQQLILQGEIKDSSNPKSALQRFLEEKRYLVFIDDVQPQKLQWGDIQDAFPINDRGNRIILTTRSCSVATAYSSGVYIYKMPCLDEASSKDLFWKKVCGCSTAPAPSLADGSKSILDKCDGLPLALISVANFLGGKGIKGSHLTKADCEDVGKELGKFMASDESAFQGIKNTLGQCYNSLPAYDHKICFMFTSLFPKGHPINIKRLARRLSAEGLLVSDRNGSKCLTKLIDMSMVEPASICSYLDAVKRCQLHSIMLEFGIQKSLSRNLLTLIQKNKPLHNITCPVRRLSVQSSTIVKEFELSALTSLTIFDSELLYFKERKLIQVLVLEDCKVPDRKAVDDICELAFLKYLSLRNTGIDRLPTNVRKLLCLESLHIQDTVAVKLPVEIIMLPQLAYLSGKFELLPLAGSTTTKELEEFLKNKSKLNTLAGIVVQEAQAGPFETVMLHAANLKKVKVSCIAAAASVPSFFPAPADASAPSGTPTDASAPSGTPANVSASNPSGAPDTANVTRTSTIRDHSPKETARNKKRFGFFTACICFRGKSAVEDSASDTTPGASITESFPVHRSTSAQILPPAIRNRQETGTTLASRLISCLEKPFTGLESLSIDFNGAPNDFLASLRLQFTVSSIKVRRGLGHLPGPIELRELCNLVNLQLISTGLSSQQLEDLQYLQCLEYLKLAEDHHGSWDGDFSVGQGGFASLRLLCFEAAKHPRVRIVRGAMPRLISLQLLCPDSPHTPPRADDDTVPHATAVIKALPGDDGTAGATVKIEIESLQPGDNGGTVASAEMQSPLGVDGTDRDTAEIEIESLEPGDNNGTVAAAKMESPLGVDGTEGGTTEIEMDSMVSPLGVDGTAGASTEIEMESTLPGDDDNTVAAVEMESPLGVDSTAGASTEIEMESTLPGDDNDTVAAVEMESPLGVDGIKHLGHLNEVILHHSVDDARVEAWKPELKRHKNRPCVKRQPVPL